MTLQRSAILFAFVATGLSAPLLRADPPAKTYLAVGILHKKTTGTCHDSELARFDVLSVAAGELSKVRKDLEKDLAGRCPVGNNKPCKLPTVKLVPEGKVAIVAQLVSKNQAFNCTSNGLAFYEADTFENAEKQLEKAATAERWESHSVIKRWPLPSLAPEKSEP